jgi:hypothetical protein
MLLTKMFLMALLAKMFPSAVGKDERKVINTQMFPAVLSPANI